MQLNKKAMENLLIHYQKEIEWPCVIVELTAYATMK